MRLMVIDVGGTAIKFCLMDESLKREEAGSVPTPRDTQAHFFEVIKELYLPYRDKVEGVAMSLPGFIDPVRGRSAGGGVLKYNHRTSIAPELSALLNCPVRIWNDGKCAANAELHAGALKGCQNAAVYVIGTGLGGGIIVDGHVITGKHFTAGEYSFLYNDFKEWYRFDATAGVRCSTTGLLKTYRKRKEMGEEDPLDGRLFFERVHAGEVEALGVLDAFALEAAKFIENLTVLLDLEKVAIGGGISRQEILIEKIREKIPELIGPKNEVRESSLPYPEIVPCQYFNDANLIGAYLYYLEAEGYPLPDEAKE